MTPAQSKAKAKLKRHRDNWKRTAAAWRTHYHDERRSSEDILRCAEASISALKVIRTWATFQDGIAFDRKHVSDLCQRTLDEVQR